MEEYYSGKVFAVRIARVMQSNARRESSEGASDVGCLEGRRYLKGDRVIVDERHPSAKTHFTVQPVLCRRYSVDATLEALDNNRGLFDLFGLSKHQSTALRETLGLKGGRALEKRRLNEDCRRGTSDLEERRIIW